MDIFAHALWTNAVFYKKFQNAKAKRYLAALFGVLPDLVSFAPIFIYFIFSGTYFRPSLFTNLAVAPWPVSYAAVSYNYTHSLVIFAFIFLIVTIIRKGQIYWPLLGWLLHIVIDIFTHPNFFRTPLFFPLSDYRNPYAVSWAEARFMAVNYSAIALAYLAIYLSYRGKKAKSP